MRSTGVWQLERRRGGQSLPIVVDVRGDTVRGCCIVGLLLPAGTMRSCRRRLGTSGGSGDVGRSAGGVAFDRGVTECWRTPPARSDPLRNDAIQAAAT